MRIHVLRKHTPAHEYPYQCEFCKRGFIAVQALNDHNNVHKGLKPHLCYICGAEFSHKSNMRYV